MKKNRQLKQVVTLYLDKEVLNYFKKGGRGYQMKINDALKAYIAADKITSSLLIAPSKQRLPIEPKLYVTDVTNKKSIVDKVLQFLKLKR